MGSVTSILFMSVARQDIKLPIVNWLYNNNSVWQLFKERDRQPQDNLFTLTERHGNHFYDIINIIKRYNLKSLDFLDLDILEDGLGTILQDRELLPAIRSLTIICDRLLDCNEPLSCMPVGYENSQYKMQKAFKNSEVNYNVYLNYYELEGLFIILKCLLVAMNEALAIDKVFIYIKYTV